MQKIKNLVNIVAGAIGISALDIFLELGMTDGFYTIAGLVYIVCIPWLVVLVNKKENK